MTSKALSNKFHPALNLFFFSMKKNSGLIILTTIFLLLICPGYILSLIQNRIESTGASVYNFNDISNGLIVSITVITTIVAMLFCFINFSFLYSTKSSDVYHSLPMTRTRLLLSRFCASVVPVLIPIFATYASMCGIVALDSVNGKIAPVLFGMLCNILIVLSCSAFTMIFIVCAGSIAHLVLSALALNIGAVIAVCILTELGKNYLFGYSSYGEMDLLFKSTPFLYGPIELAMILEDGIIKNGEFIKFFIEQLALASVFLVVSCLLYNRRKSEKSGVSYAYRFMYIIAGVMVGMGGAFGLGIIFGNGDYGIIFWAFALVGGILAAVTFGAITDKGFKTVKQSVVIGVSSLLIIAVTALVMYTGGFGFETRVPSTDKGSLKSAAVDFRNIGFMNSYIEFKPENSGAIIKLQEKIIKNEIARNRSDALDSQGNYNMIQFKYTLPSGKMIYREYNIDYSDYYDDLLKIYKSEENKESVKNMIKQLSASNTTVAKYANYLGRDISDVYITKSEVQQIVDAYIKDIENATTNSITGNVDQYCFSGMDDKKNYHSYTILVEEGFTRTNEVIDSLELSKRESILKTQ